MQALVFKTNIISDSKSTLDTNTIIINSKYLTENIFDYFDYISLLNKKKGYQTAGIISFDSSVEENTVIISEILSKSLSVDNGEKISLRKIYPAISKTLILKYQKSYEKIISQNYFKKLLIKNLYNIPFFINNLLLNRNILLKVVKVNNITDFETPYVITKDTIVKFVSDSDIITTVKYSDIGGLTDEIKEFLKVLTLPLLKPEYFKELNIEPPKGILLYGPPGTGKTLLGKAIANESNSSFFVINGPECTSKFYGESEKKIRQLFKKARDNAPSIIFIDEIDVVAPNREKIRDNVEKRIVTQLLTEMDGLKERDRVIVIGATNLPNSLDLAIRRGGRFDKEIEFKPPNYLQRADILEKITRTVKISEDVNLKEWALKTHGFVGADLKSLIQEAGINSIINYDNDKTGQIKLEISTINISNIFHKINPSALREFMFEKPTVTWKDIGGLDDEIKNIIEEISMIKNNYKDFEKYSFSVIKGILLYGPPGTGKTLLGKAIANEIDFNFINIKGPELLNKYYGETEERIRNIFKKAKSSAPSIIFIDEIDSLCSNRSAPDSGSKFNDKIVGQLLTEIDGLVELKQVIIIGTTNKLQNIDPALLRSGRFDKLIKIKVPDKTQLIKIFALYLKRLPLNFKIDDITFIKLCDDLSLKKYTGADVYNICRILLKNYIIIGTKKLITIVDLIESINQFKKDRKENEIQDSSLDYL